MTKDEAQRRRWTLYEAVNSNSITLKGAFRSRAKPAFRYSRAPWEGFSLILQISSTMVRKAFAPVGLGLLPRAFGAELALSRQAKKSSCINLSKGGAHVVQRE
jgi:hypothetical protein